MGAQDGRATWGQPAASGASVITGALRVTVMDQATRLFLLSRVVDSLTSTSLLNDGLQADLPADLVDRLRGLPLAEALQLCIGDCGVSIVIDSSVMRQSLERTARMHIDRTIYEHLVRCGASPSLLSRLFKVSTAEVRAFRRLVAPSTCSGGRPKLLQDEVRDQVIQETANLRADGVDEREIYYQLAVRFPEIPFSSLEAVLQRRGADRH